MTQISNLTGSVDTRTAWKKMSRRQLWKGRTKFDISFQVGAKHSEMVSMYQAKGISPEQVVQFVPVQVPEPDGSTKTVMYPEAHERKFDEQKELRRFEEMERRIAAGIENEEKRLSADKQKMEAEKNVEIQGLKTELDDLKAMMQKLLEQKVQVQVSPETPKEVDPYKMKFMAQRKWLKARGVELKKGDNPATLIDEVYNAPKSLTGS